MRRDSLIGIRGSWRSALLSPNFYLLTSALLAYLLLPLPGWGAWGTGGATCSATEEPAADNSVTCTVGTQNLEAGNVVICRGATDNVDTVDDATTLHSWSDSAGNSYTKIYEQTRGAGAGSAAGVTVSAFYSIATTQLTSGSGTITLTTSTNVVDKAIECSEFTITSGSTVATEGAVKAEAVNGGDPGSLTTDTITSREHLFLRVVGTESNLASSMTATSSYTLLPTDGCTNTIGGSEGSDIGVCTEYRILTGTSDSSDPTLADTTNDNASVYAALNEDAPAGGNPKAGPRVHVADAGATEVVGDSDLAWARGR